ncbi:MAG: glycosyltransferase family 2 protein [Chloroflexota bacterium]
MIPEISIIICTRNRNERIRSTLDSICQNQGCQFEVIVIDQSTNESTQIAVRPFLDDPRFIYKRTNTSGLSIARNIGIFEARGEIIAFTDDDCRVTNNWVESIVQEFRTHAIVDSVFGRIIPGILPAGSELKQDFNVDKAKRLQQVMPVAKKEEPTHKVYQESPHDLGFGHGANMCFRRSVFLRHGVFDEFLGAGAKLGAWEDRDMGYRILTDGGKILYSPNVVIYHDHWREWPEVKDAYKNYAIGTGTAVNKYVRIGNWGSIYLLFDWIIQMGIRQILSGLFKWQSWQKIYVGMMQLIYPWIGLWQSRQYAIDPHYRVYIGKKGETQKAPIIKPPRSTSE